MKQLNRGFSLIEVLVFLTILSMIFIGAAVLGTASIRNSKNAENKIIASRHGEELLDWLRSQKEIDWLDFSTLKSSPDPGTTYCFNDEPVVKWPTNTPCGSDLMDGIFKREAILTYDSSTDRVNVEIKLTWSEGGNSYDVTTKGVFSLFE